MKKTILFAVLILLPFSLFSQNEKPGGKNKINREYFSVQAQYSNKFVIQEIDFNKRIDGGGRGEILEVQMIIKNLTDTEMDLYIFTVATYEKLNIKQRSFDPPIPEKERVRSFVPYPNDLKNFEYPKIDLKGNIIKDKNGNPKVILVKHPKDPRAGININTGKPYHLINKLSVRTRHLSKYRANYYYFNEVALLIFDGDGKPAFRQLYVLKGKRR